MPRPGSPSRPSPALKIGCSQPLSAAFLHYHGVAGLLADRGDVLSPEAERHVRAQAMWEMRHRLELADILKRFAEAGVDHALMKGTALAYSLYPSPHLRSRGDSDILVSPTALADARRILTALGYASVPVASVDDETGHQESWLKSTADEALHVIDLHWSVMNGAALASIFPVGECLARAEELPALSSIARRLCTVHMLAHACLHRMMHRTAPYRVGDRAYVGADRLVWAFDIALLCAAMTADDRRGVIDFAERSGIAGTILDGIRFAERETDLIVDPELYEVLARLGRGSTLDRYFLTLGRRGRAWANLKASGSLPMMARRLSLATRAQFPQVPPWALPFFHLLRLVEFALDRSRVR